MGHGKYSNEELSDKEDPMLYSSLSGAAEVPSIIMCRLSIVEVSMP